MEGLGLALGVEGGVGVFGRKNQSIFSCFSPHRLFIVAVCALLDKTTLCEALESPFMNEYVKFSSCHEKILRFESVRRQAF